MYRRIVDDEHLDREHPWICIHPDEFQWQLKVMDRSGFTILAFQDHKPHLEEELEFSKKPAILTFDDGYQVTHEVAVPLLQDFRMKAVIFVVRGQGSNRVLGINDMTCLLFLL